MIRQILCRKSILAFALFVFITLPLGAQSLFPTPANRHSLPGYFLLSEETEVKADGQTESKSPINRLRKAIAPFTQEKKEKNKIVVTLNESFNFPEEGYALQVSSDSIVLSAATETGLFHGQETLLQLARFGKGKIRCCNIKDAPRYQWRGFMLDESRHFFGKEKVKQYLDIMASLHLNVFHWHLTDEPGWRIEVKKYPRLTQVGAKGNYTNPNAAPAFYTQEEIKEVVAYAAERQITVIPEFDMPGHATAVCRAYPEYSGGGEGRRKHFTFHPAKESTYQFISDVLDELITLFPSPYIHIGGDEVHFGNQSWFTDPEIQQFIKEKGLRDEKGLEHYFLRRVADMIASKGKVMIGWDEVIDAGISPAKAVVMWWRHDRSDRFG